MIYIFWGIFSQIHLATSGGGGYMQKVKEMFQCQYMVSYLFLLPNLLDQVATNYSFGNSPNIAAMIWHIS